MIIFGSVEILHQIVASEDHDYLAVFNLSGYKEGFVPLRILPQDGSIFFTNDEKVSDIAFLKYIYDNDAIFYEFFSKVMYPFYSGIDVYIIIDDRDADNMAFEIALSVMKIIQQRYGYTPIYVSEYEDLHYVNKDSNMNINGIYNFDQDKLRYMALSVNSTGVPKVDGLDDPDQYADNLLQY